MPEMFVLPFRPVYDTNGKFIPGAKAWFTLTGTNTPSPVYSDAGITVALANPIIASAAGKFPKAYLKPGVTYRVRIYDAGVRFVDGAPVGGSTPIEEYDPYTASLEDSSVFKGYTVDTLPAPVARMSIFVTDEGEHGSPAFSDGTAWFSYLTGLEISPIPSLPLQLVAEMGGVETTYLRSLADGFFLGFNFANGKSTEFRAIKDADGLLHVRGGWVGASGPSVSSTLRPSTLTSISSQQPLGNSYTVTVGGRLDFPSFTGTGFSFNHFADDRGGLWRFTIDAGTASQQIVDVSVWASPSVSLKLSPVITGLPFGVHTVSAVFQGNDPAHTPTATARGWFRYSTTDATIKMLNVFGTDLALNQVTKTEVMPQSSVTIFAIASAATGSGHAQTWTPIHSGQVDVAKAIVRTISKDGVTLPGDVADITADYEAIDELRVVQTYSAYNANDATDSFKLWDGTVTQIFAGGVLQILHTITLTSDVFFGGTYLAPHLAGLMPGVDTFAANGGITRTLAAVDSQENLPGEITEALMYHSTAGRAVAASVTNFADVASDGVLFAKRTDGVMKMYWEWAGVETRPPGTVGTSNATLALGDAIDITNLVYE